MDGWQGAEIRSSHTATSGHVLSGENVRDGLDRAWPGQSHSWLACQLVFRIHHIFPFTRQTKPRGATLDDSFALFSLVIAIPPTSIYNINNINNINNNNNNNDMSSFLMKCIAVLLAVQASALAIPCPQHQQQQQQQQQQLQPQLQPQQRSAQTVTQVVTTALPVVPQQPQQQQPQQSSTRSVVLVQQQPPPSAPRSVVLVEQQPQPQPQQPAMPVTNLNIGNSVNVNANIRSGNGAFFFNKAGSITNSGAAVGNKFSLGNSSTSGSIEFGSVADSQVNVNTGDAHLFGGSGSINGNGINVNNELNTGGATVGNLNVANVLNSTLTTRTGGSGWFRNSGSSSNSGTGVGNRIDLSNSKTKINGNVAIVKDTNNNVQSGVGWGFGGSGDVTGAGIGVGLRVD